MLTHPPWTRLACVRSRLQALWRRVAERLILLLGDGLGEAVRSAAEGLLLGRQSSRRPEETPHVDPYEHPTVGEFGDEWPAEVFDEPDPVELSPPRQTRHRPAFLGRLWKAALSAATWLVYDVPRRRPVPAVLFVLASALLTCWPGPVTSLIGLGRAFVGLG